VALARISKVTIEDLLGAFVSLYRDTSCRDWQGTPGAENRGIGQKFITYYLVEELGEASAASKDGVGVKVMLVGICQGV
jgi:hypothetical protein